jgi:hypothetical protein
MSRFTMGRAGLPAFLAALLICSPGIARAEPAPLPDQMSTLACLVKAGPALQLPAAALQLAAPAPPAYVRLRLLFESADRPPAVEVLASTADASVREAVLSHVAGYRLPCLTQRPLAAFQEFQFASDLLPAGGPLLPTRGPASTDSRCVMPPLQPLDPPTDRPGLLVKTLVLLSFSGDGESPPAVKVLGTNADERFIRVVVKHVEGTRAPCRKAGDWPLHAEQMFRVRYGGDQIKPARFTKERVPLSEFLGYMPDARDQRVFFDFDTMHCPFTLRWTLNQPWTRNQISEVDGRDPNREALVRWLSRLRSGLKPDLMEQLIGESLLVDVPCGQLNLRPTRG